MSFWDRVRRVLIYDSCGRTFDVTLLVVHHKKMELLATNGRASLGGVDIDFVVQEHLIELLEELPEETMSDERF